MVFESPIQSQRLALLHAGAVVILTAWVFGGNATRTYIPLAVLAAFAWPLTIGEIVDRFRTRNRHAWRSFLSLSPLLGFCLLVAISALNPSHRPDVFFETAVLRPIEHLRWLPTSGRPALSAGECFWLASLYLTGWNLFWCVSDRIALRRLAFVLVFNAAVLAVFGTIYRLVGTEGLLFGLVPSTNSELFASFIYRNHWGAFAVMHVCLALALAWDEARGQDLRASLHTRAPALLVAALALAATAPISGSRSITVLMTLIFIGTSIHFTVHRWARAKNRLHAVISAGLLGLVVLSAALAIYALSAPVVASRWDDTLQQIDAERAGRAHYSRLQLYRDAWHLAQAKPVFGWGLECFGNFFALYYTAPRDSAGIRDVYVDAHNDWLQSLGETGFVGTALVIAMAAVPFVMTMRRVRLRLVSKYTLCGPCLIAAYAWLELPFANHAVIAMWWVVFFLGLKYSELSAPHT